MACWIAAKAASDNLLEPRRVLGIQPGKHCEGGGTRHEAREAADVDALAVGGAVGGWGLPRVGGGEGPGPLVGTNNFLAKRAS